MKIGLIGCGGMGKVHGTVLAQLAKEMDITVCAIADKVEGSLREVAAQWPQAALYADGDGVLEHPGLEAVHICVPTNLHTRYAVKAMAQKLAVLLEKPVCLTPEEEAALLQAQGEHQAPVMVGHVVRFFEEYLFLESAVREQRYGPLESLVMHRLSPKPAWGWNNWFEDPAQSGTVLWDLHIHDADFIRYLLGEPKAVRVEGYEGQRGQPVQVVATYDYGTDLLVQAEGNWANAAPFPFQMGYRANFSGATVAFSSAGTPQLSVFHGDGKVEHPLQAARQQESAAARGVNVDTILPYYHEIRYFYTRLLSGRAIEKCTLRDAIQSVRLVRKEMEVYKKQRGTA